MGVHLAGTPQFRQDFPGYTELAEYPIVVVHGGCVEQARCRGVGVIGDMYTTASQFPDEPGVYGTKEKLPTSERLLDHSILFHEPPYLC